MAQTPGSPRSPGGRRPAPTPLEDSPSPSSPKGSSGARAPRERAPTSPSGGKASPAHGGGSPRSPKGAKGSAEVDGKGAKHRKRGEARDSRYKLPVISCPKCKCCLYTLPCFFCCHPDQILDRKALVEQAKQRSKGHAINMDLIDEQLQEDRLRRANHKRKWRRRWIIFCCAFFCFASVGAIVAILYLAIGSWTGLNLECDWSPRLHFGVVYTTDGRVVMAGGRDGSQNLGDVWEGNKDGTDWLLLASDAEFGPRHGHALVYEASQGYLYVIAGDSGGVGFGVEPSPLADVWRSKDGRNWTQQVAEAPWPARKFFGGAADGDGVLYIAGGLSGHGLGGLNDMWKSEDDGVTWTPVLHAAPWSARYSFGFVRLHSGIGAGRFYILGGNDGRRQHDVWVSDDSGETWQLMRFSHYREMRETFEEYRAPWWPRDEIAAVADSDGLVTLLAGRTGEESNVDLSQEVWQMPPPPGGEKAWYEKATTDERLSNLHDPLEWSEKGKPPWFGRHGHAAFVDDERIPYIIGGQDADGPLHDMWKMKTSLDLLNLQRNLQGVLENIGLGDLLDDGDSDSGTNQSSTPPVAPTIDDASGTNLSLAG